MKQVAILGLTAMLACVVSPGVAPAAQAQNTSGAVLQPLADKPGPAPAALKTGGYYVPATPATVRWGALPNAQMKPVLSMPSGSVVTFDTISHEGILEDQGRDP